MGSIASRSSRGSRATRRRACSTPSRAGELVTLLGGHPSLAIRALLEAERHDIADILRESLAHEKAALGAYYDLLKIVAGQWVLLEEYAREMIGQEELHSDEVNKMLRKPSGE